MIVKVTQKYVIPLSESCRTVVTEEGKLWGPHVSVGLDGVFLEGGKQRCVESVLLEALMHSFLLIPELVTQIMMLNP